MCGIFGYIGTKTNAAQITLSGLKKLEYRGYDSWGIAIVPIGKEQIEIEKHVGKIGEVETKLPQGSIAIGHTRWATHGGVTDLNAHPHLDCTGQIAVIHNGIVENHAEIKNTLKQKGHRFLSETDTEVVAHLIEEELKTKVIEKAVFSTFKKLVGSNAVAVLDLKGKKIIVCRNGSPIVIGFGVNENYIASDVPAFLDKTNKVHFLLDGEGAVITSNAIKIFDLAKEKIKEMKIQTIDWKVTDAQKQGYPHFLLKEIMEQKKTISKTSLINETELQKLGGMIAAGDQVVMVGCGSAAYCATAAKYFFAGEKIAAEVYGAYEFLPFADFCNKKTIFIAVSQSGETAETIIAARAAKEKGAYITAIVNARGSTLERMADSVLPVAAGPEIAVVSTKAFTSQLATLFLLSLSASGKLKVGKTDIKELGEIVSVWLTPKIQKNVIVLAKTLLDKEDIYVIGKKENYPAALEFALKIKETSYIHGEAFAAGELKHGVITLIQPEVPCFVLSSDDNHKQEILSSAAQVKARGGRIIGVAPFRAQEFDDLVLTPSLKNPILSIFFNVIVGQLLGYYLGVGRGVDPDKPRNLAKSVTVK